MDKLGKNQERILKLLSAENRPLKTVDIAKRLKLDINSTRDSANRLLKQRYIIKYKQGANSYWQLSTKLAIKKHRTKEEEYKVIYNFANEFKPFIKEFIKISEFYDESDYYVDGISEEENEEKSRKLSGEFKKAIKKKSKIYQKKYGYSNDELVKLLKENLEELCEDLPATNYGVDEDVNTMIEVLQKGG